MRASVTHHKHYLSIALGSCNEIEYQLLLAKDLDYITSASYDELMSLLCEVIGSLINYMEKIS